MVVDLVLPSSLSWFLIDHPSSPSQPGGNPPPRNDLTVLLCDDRRGSGMIRKMRAGRSYVNSQDVTVGCYGSPAGRRLALDPDRSGSASARLTKVTGGDPNLDSTFAALQLLCRAEEVAYRGLGGHADPRPGGHACSARSTRPDWQLRIGSDAGGYRRHRPVSDVTLERVRDALRLLTLDQSVDNATEENVVLGVLVRLEPVMDLVGLGDGKSSSPRKPYPTRRER